MTTKDNIINNSFNLFAANGYSASSIRSIARNVGIRESAIYNHFPSKRDIFLACLKKYESTLNVKEVLNDDIIDSLDKPMEFLKKYTAKIIEQWKNAEEIKLFSLILKENGNEIIPEILSFQNYISRNVGLLEVVFDEMIKLNFIKGSNGRKLAENYFAPLLMFRITNMYKPEKINENDIRIFLDLHIENFGKIIEIK